MTTASGAFVLQVRGGPSFDDLFKMETVHKAMGDKPCKKHQICLCFNRDQRALPDAS